MNFIVSIITPSYNSSKTITETIDSVINQSYQNWELIIVDDNSTDNTLSIINGFIEKDSRIKLLELNQNRGAGYCRNKAIEVAVGRFIAFLDSDDTWHPLKLEKQVKFMIDNKYALTYTAYNKVDQNLNVTKNITPPYRVNYSSLIKSNVIGCLTAMYDTELIGKVYMPLIRKRQDMALWLIILKKIDYAWCLNETLASYREGHDSLSSNKFRVIFSQWKFYRCYLQLNFFKTLWYFSFYIIKAIKKHST
ncbi:glycosyltransferase family 2 protein [Kluyvera cryocrescens]|uniref:glycosyltransferase family 2 protein n=1 Tax=Kluyvera cryocrescens TaxID=580 RepID=UPI003D7F2F02